MGIKRTELCSSVGTLIAFLVMFWEFRRLAGVRIPREPLRLRKLFWAPCNPRDCIPPDVKYAQNSPAQGSDLPQLTNERWIDIGIQVASIFIFSRRLCVIFVGDTSRRQLDLKVVVRVTFREQPSLSLEFNTIDKRSIRVDKIEYHPA